MMAERHTYIGLILGVLISAAVALVIAMPILKFMGKEDASLESAKAKKDSMKRQAKGLSEPAEETQTALAFRVTKIAFACDAGMGSSAMGATVLKKKLLAAGITDIEVIHTPVSSIPKDVQVVVTHEELGERAAHSKELLYRENIKVGCEPDTQKNVIRKAGQMLAETGYVKPSYIDGMLEREKSFSTYMGNELALPHGVEAAKKDIKASGIAVMIFPEGTPWGNETVKIVIGIAGVGEEHLAILSVIADKMLAPEAAEKLVNADADTVYEMLSDK